MTENSTVVSRGVGEAIAEQPGEFAVAGLGPDLGDHRFDGFAGETAFGGGGANHREICCSGARRGSEQRADGGCGGGAEELLAIHGVLEVRDDGAKPLTAKTADGLDARFLIRIGGPVKLH